MATFKHISSKNADYGAAEQYLTFEHDEFTMKPTLDGNGRLVLRDDYRISSLNCGGEDFAIACMRSNLKYGKNQKREDVKSHHYIISFDPRDAADNGLSVDRAQQLGEQFCKEHFPGHQALVCTHPDGHNHSGNIHVHIVINSLRIAEVPLLPYMERPADTREGCKHRCTDAAMEYFKAEVMEMCHRENLYQIDLLNGSKNRVTEREYWAKRKGQAALDKENASLAATGEPPKLTKFETDKEKLRRTIRTALSSATSFEDFSGKLLQQGVTVKESRGRLSYTRRGKIQPYVADTKGRGETDRQKTKKFQIYTIDSNYPVTITVRRCAMSKILIVEDDLSIQALLHDFIQEAGYSVVLAADGVEALAKYSEQSFDLILLDIMLPKIDGFGVCEVIRQKSDVPIIMLTALDDEGNQLKGLDLQADDYITKPFSMPVLLRKIAAVLRRSSKQNDIPQTMSYKDLTLDLEGYKVYTKEESIDLTPREFEILRELLIHKGRILTRQNLLQTLWKYEFFGEERIVDTHIKNLRKKLGAADYIETIRGVGYRIDKED